MPAEPRRSRPSPSVGVHQRVERAGGHLAARDRLGEEEALPVCAAQGAHPVGLLGGLDPLGDGPDLERATHRHDRSGKGRGPRVAVGDLDELAGDLEDVDRELAEVAQREVAGPEVVDDDPDAELAQRLEGRDRRRRRLEQGRLGDLEAEPRGSHPRLRERLLDGVTKPGCWISRAETFTHRNADRSMFGPGHRLAAGFAQDPAADRQDRAVLLGDLDELAGRDHATLRVLPADERLDAGQAPSQVDDRLIDESQWPSSTASLELGAELVALADRGVHARVEDREAGLAVGLGHVHRDVGVADDVGGTLRRIASARDADAGRDRDGLLADHVRRSEFAGEPLGHRKRALEVRGVCR